MARLDRRAPGTLRACSAAPADSVSSISSRSGPRSQSCAGISKPIFFRCRIAGGSLPFIRSFKITFWRVPRILKSSRQRGGELHDAVIQKWRPHFDRMRHAHAVHLHQNVVRQIVALIEPKIGRQVVARRAAVPPGSRSSAPASGAAQQRAFLGVGECAVPIHVCARGVIRQPSRKRFSMYSKLILSSETGQPPRRRERQPQPTVRARAASAARNRSAR